MTEEKENKALDKDSDKKAITENKSSSKGKFIFILLIILILFSAIGFFLNNRLNKIQAEINQSQTNSHSITKENAAQIKEILSRFASMQEKLEELESKQDVLSHSLSQPVEQQIYINEDYALSEIEHLLIIASYNLQLDHNVVTALAAMEAADTRLKGLTDPAVLSVREQLIADMNELRSLNQADLSGLGLYLSDLISRVDQLALKDNVVLEKKEVIDKSNEEPVQGVKHFFTLVLDELKSLIVITRDKDVGKARLLPDEVYFLRANLKLEMANARFAVFNRDTDNLHVSIDHIQNWLNDYYDLSDADVRNVYDSLSSMKKLELSFPALDISSSLESVRALNRFQNEYNNNVSEEEVVPVE